MLRRRTFISLQKPYHKLQNRRRSRPCVEALEGRALLSGFYDGFESATLNLFWTRSTYSALTKVSRSSNAHGGSYSVELDYDINLGIQLTHFFDQPTYGTVSVWIYGTGGGGNKGQWFNFAIRSNNHVAQITGDNY